MLKTVRVSEASWRVMKEHSKDLKVCIHRCSGLSHGILHFGGYSICDRGTLLYYSILYGYRRYDKVIPKTTFIKHRGRTEEFLMRNSPVLPASSQVNIAFCVIVHRIYVTDFFEISRKSRFMKGLKSASEVEKSILGHF